MVITLWRLRMGSWCVGGRRLMAAAALLALGLVGCSPKAPPRKLQVVATFLPISLFTKAVAGDCAEVSSLVPPQAGPHDFQARPADLVALQNAQVLVKNGLGIEEFLDKLIASAASAQLKVIDSSQGVVTISNEEPAGHHHDHEHGHDHAHVHGPVNPHIWLDPQRAAQQVTTIRDGLIAADPGCAPTYRRNAEHTVAALRQLDTEIAGQLRPYAGKTFVAFHDFAPYFAQRYGLKAEFLVDLPEQNPSPADLQRVAGIVQRSQLRALLSEPQVGARSFNALAADLGIRVSEFDGLETASPADAANPKTYFKVMRNNVSRLRESFKP
jgi:zinc transport system substrate-binding protein